MVEYASGSIHFSGLGSDTDFDDMISKLYKIESRQAQQLLRWKADWQTRLDAFQQIRTEMLKLQTALTSINSVNKFLVKTAASSKPEVATATPGFDALSGVYDLDVKQLATQATWSKNTGLSYKTDVVNDSGANATFSYVYKGKTRTLTIPPGTTLEGLVNFINKDSQNPGVKAQIISDSRGMVFQLRGMDTGYSASLAIEDTTGLNGLGVDLVRKWQTTSNSAQLLTNYADGNAVINDTGAAGTFQYYVDGALKTVDVPAGMTLQELADALNAKESSYTDFAQLVPDGGGAGVNLKLSIPDKARAFAPDASCTDFLGMQFAATMPTDPADPIVYGNTSVNTGTEAKTFDFTMEGVNNGNPVTITVNPGETADSVLAKLKNAVGDKAEAKYTIDDVSKTVQFSITPKDVTHTVQIGAQGLAATAYTYPTASDWAIQQNVNGQVRLNGWPAEPDYMEVESNSVTGLSAGMTFNLRSVGQSVITVDVDTEAITQNIQSFVDAVNAFQKVVMDLTKVDTNKKVLSSDYAESQFEMQKGSVLTGNYGIQLMDSRITQAISGQAKGFMYLTRLSETAFVGDMFSSLSQIGIVTNSQEGSANYGLLEINTTSRIADQAIANNADATTILFKGSLTLEEALKKDPEAVARLFAAKLEGQSYSPYFEHNSHVDGITKAGIYDVSYETDGSGNIIKATINGKTANIDNVNRQIGMFDNKDPAGGIMLDIHDLTPNKTFTGQVGIRDGKVNELLSMMQGTEGFLGERGTLKILEKNYQGIMDNIDKKIQKEDERLIKWERTTRLRFARLEETLSRYNSINEGLKSQISQMQSSTKK